MLDALNNRKNAQIQDRMDDINDSLNLSPRIPVRVGQQLYGLTKDGHKVGFIMCSRCADHMIWCECDKILGPDNVAMFTGAAKDLAELHPRMVQLMTTI
jgi:hypothetical protein